MIYAFAPHDHYVRFHRDCYDVCRTELVECLQLHLGSEPLRWRFGYTPVTSLVEVVVTHYPPLWIVGQSDRSAMNEYRVKQDPVACKEFMLKLEAARDAFNAFAQLRRL